MKAPAAAPANTKIKFSMKIHGSAGKALKAQIAAMKATKATAKDRKKALAKDIAYYLYKDTKKAIAKDIKKGITNDSKEDRNEAQGVLDIYIEELDLYTRGLEKVETGPSNTNTGVSSKVEDWIEKTLSNLSIDQV